MADQQNNKPAKTSAESHSQKELDDVEKFCKEVGYEEISFDSWCEHHSSLDLSFFIFIPRDEVPNGFSKEIVMSRTVSKHGPQGKVVTKEKVRHLVNVPPNITEGHQIVIKGGGDLEADRHGDLIVNVRFS